MFLLNLTLPLHSWDSKPFGVGHSNIQPNYLNQSVNKIKQLPAAYRAPGSWDVTEGTAAGGAVWKLRGGPAPKEPSALPRDNAVTHEQKKQNTTHAERAEAPLP